MIDYIKNCLDKNYSLLNPAHQKNIARLNISNKIESERRVRQRNAFLLKLFTLQKSALTG